MRISDWSLDVCSSDLDGKDDKKAWITIAVTYDPALLKPDAANPDLLKPDDADKQVQAAAARMDGWAYLVPESELPGLTRHLKDLLEADKPDAQNDAKKPGCHTAPRLDPSDRKTVLQGKR